MSLQRCSERAFAMCPTRHLCGTRYDATFSDNSDCAEFNKKVDSMPITNADRIRAMSDRELADFLSSKFAEVGLAEHTLSVIQLNAVKQNLFCIFMNWLKRPAEEVKP